VKRLGALITGFLSLLIGMKVTLKTMFQTLSGKAVTLQYPREKPELSPNFRSAIKLIRFEETNSHDCVACLQCEKICPSYCIKIEGGKIEGIKKKRATKFTMDFALCSLCGLCLDVCPTTTLEYSRLYDDASYSRDWDFDLLEGFTEFEPTFVAQQTERETIEAAQREAKKKAAAAAKAAAKAAAEATPAEEA
jgi:formate hydrogenlyase subunit 6/NADH:ubiquinone oxidoreductase subunit I